MKYVSTVVLVALIGLAMSGCFPPGASDAAILSFAFEGLSLTVEIDPEARTVVVSSPPIDLSSISPTIEVTPDSSLTGPSELSDGDPAIYTLTDAGGESVEWTVTVNLERGMTFRLDGEWIVLLNGTDDVVDPIASGHADRWGNGSPNVWFGYMNSAVFSALRDPYEFDEGSAGPPPVIGLLSDFSSSYAGPGTYDTMAQLEYTVDEDLDTIPEVDFLGASGSIVITQDSLENGSIVTGTFAFSGTESVSDNPMSATDGYLKVLRVEGSTVYSYPWTDTAG